MNMKKKWLLGQLKDDSASIYLEDFSWDCGWYWGGGYIGNRNLHCHFDGCFLDCPDSRGHALGPFYDPWTKPPEYIKTFYVISNGAAVWEDLGFFLNNPQYTPAEWWKIKDLFKQFYAMKSAAECFQYGGHCSGKVSENEKNPWMAAAINKHIETVIIPEIRKWLDHENRKTEEPKEENSAHKS